MPSLTVHDELDFSDPDTPASREGFAEMAHIMETAVPCRVPIVVDGERGPNWADLTDLPRTP